MVRIAITALLASCVAAFPGNVLERAPLPQTTSTRCNRDNCLRAVVASNTPGGQARGSSDCSSFLATAVVTPCAITSTITQTFPSTVTVVTSTITVTLGSSTVNVNPTGSSTISVTSISTTTLTQTTPSVVTEMKIKAREAQFFDFLFARTLTTTSTCVVQATMVGIKARSQVCSAITMIMQGPTGRTIPAYATSGCMASNSAAASSRYSSACRCDGVTAGTSTMPTPTISSTASSTVPVTGTSTATVTATSGISTVTGGITTITSIVNSVITVTTIVSSLTTMTGTVTLPVCTSTSTI